jgi:GT2 family glycosyltransferase
MSGNKVDIIIPVYNKPAMTLSCLNSIGSRTRIPYRLIIIDNASDEETGRSLEGYKASHENVVLIRNTDNIGWVKAVNQGIAASSAGYVCIMNNDTLAETDGWLEGLIEAADSSDDIGLVNPEFDSRRSVPCSGIIEIDFCRGYCVLIKRAVIDKIGGLDESYGLGYYDDDDYSVRAIHAGFRCVKTSAVIVWHLRDSTFTSLFSEEKRLALHEANKRLFYSRWGRRLRLVFIVTSDANNGDMKRLLLSLARSQHIIYLWNVSGPLKISHTGVKERLFPPLISAPVFSLAIKLNGIKKEAKRYDAVFVDNSELGKFLSKACPVVRCFEAGKDSGEVMRIAEEIARAR